MTTETDKVLLLVRNINTLRHQLDEAEDQLDKLLVDATDSKAERGEESKAGRGRKPIPGGLTDSVIKLLHSAPNKKFSAEEVLDESGLKTSLASVRATLWRLAKSNKIRKVGKDRYRVSEKDA